MAGFHVEGDEETRRGFSTIGEDMATVTDKAQGPAEPQGNDTRNMPHEMKAEQRWEDYEYRPCMIGKMQRGALARCKPGKTCAPDQVVAEP